MPHSHAVVRIDHQNARVLKFDAEHLEAQKVKEHSDYTRQHGSEVRTEHEFFGHVCDELAGIAEVLITGPHTAQADFKHYVEKHRPALAKQIVGWETVDHPTDGELVKLAREYFLKHDRLDGTLPLD
jgi:stalled ribosome rescue protein Dom34